MTNCNDVLFNALTRANQPCDVLVRAQKSNMSQHHLSMLVRPKRHLTKTFFQTSNLKILNQPEPACPHL